MRGANSAVRFGRLAPLPSLPAAMATNTPRDTAYSTAASTAGAGPPFSRPMLMLMTCAPLSAA